MRTHQVVLFFCLDIQLVHRDARLSDLLTWVRRFLNSGDTIGIGSICYLRRRSLGTLPVAVADNASDDQQKYNDTPDDDWDNPDRTRTQLRRFFDFVPGQGFSGLRVRALFAGIIDPDSLTETISHSPQRSSVLTSQIVSVCPLTDETRHKDRTAKRKNLILTDFNLCLLTRHVGFGVWGLGFGVWGL